MSGLAGQASDIDIYAREILRMREILNGILADATGQDVERIAATSTATTSWKPNRPWPTAWSTRSSPNASARVPSQ